jgi:DNA invertase Pin-like site-specific DNA recombinase
MVACYGRVSSRQRRPDSQKAEIHRWLRHNRIRARRVVWVEATETGRSLKRPAFARLQHELLAGTVEMVGGVETGSALASPTRRHQSLGRLV